MKALVFAALGLAACSNDGTQQYVEGFSPPPPPPGYTRFVTPPHMFMPGDDVNYCEFIAPPFDRDLDVAGSQGYQSKTGHHLSLYGTTDTTTPVGTTRPCTSDDMLSIQFIGAVGGEGVNTDVTKLPPGTAFRLPKGKALMSNTHYLNATPNAVMVQSVVDVKFDETDSGVTPLGAFTLHADAFVIPVDATSYSYEAHCTAQQDFPIVMACNHMHDHGVAMLTEVIHLDGSHTTIVEDPIWDKTQGFNPRWERWDTAAPLTVKQGETVHTKCTWFNDTDHKLGFPEEMCDGATYWLNGTDAVYCRGG